jgi:hypothetical protein
MASMSSVLDTRRRLVLAAMSTVLAVGGCAAPADDVVPGCPHCGDPVTVVGKDGRPHVLPRMRLQTDGAATLDMALGLGPWTLVRDADAVAEPSPAPPPEPMAR